MAPSYSKICKKLLQQKQLGDKRNELLYKKVNCLERKAIELETLTGKCEELKRENFFLELEVKELKKPLDAAAIKSLEQKSKNELVTDILALMAQMSVLEKTNTELWIDKRRLSRQLDALKLNPLAVNSKPMERISHAATSAAPGDLNLSSIMDDPFISTYLSADESCSNDEVAYKGWNIGKKISSPVIPGESPIRFSTPIKRLSNESKLARIPAEKNWLPTPPIAVIPYWCCTPVKEDSSSRTRSMVVSTMFSDYVDHDLGVDNSVSYSAATSYRRIKIPRSNDRSCNSTSVLSNPTTVEQIDDGTVSVPDSSIILSTTDDLSD